jgi:ABC-type sugar transport system substrate-binding protein
VADVNIETNDYVTGLQLAKIAATHAGTPCRAGVITGLATVTVLAQRNKGLIDGLKQAGCQILATQQDQDTADSAKAIADAWKTKYGNEMNVLAVYTDNSALGAMSSTDQSFNPYIVSFNGDDGAIQAMRKPSSRFVADGVVLFPEIGNGIGVAAGDLLAGVKLPKTIISRMRIVTPSNVGSYQSYAARLRVPMQVAFVREGNETVLQATQP